MTFAYTDHHLALGERCVGNTSTAWLSNLTLRDGKSSRHLTKTMTCLGETVHKGARNPFFLDFLPRNGHLNVKTTLSLENSWRLINLSSLRCFKETQSQTSKANGRQASQTCLWLWCCCFSFFNQDPSFHPWPRGTRRHVILLFDLQTFPARNGEQNHMIRLICGKLSAFLFFSSSSSCRCGMVRSTLPRSPDRQTELIRVGFYLPLTSICMESGFNRKCHSFFSFLSITSLSKYTCGGRTRTLVDLWRTNSCNVKRNEIT